LLGVHGLELISQIAKGRADFKCVVTARNPTFPIAVQAIKAGATDFVEKSLDCSALLASVSEAFDEADLEAANAARQNAITRRISNLTVRQHQILELVLEGEPSKRIAANLGISQRTVENHRAAIARKAGSKSFAGLIHAGFCAHCSLNGASHAIEIGGASQ
jgi:two-component system CheB/CheR fusion protein